MADVSFPTWLLFCSLSRVKKGVVEKQSGPETQLFTLRPASAPSSRSRGISGSGECLPRGTTKCCQETRLIIGIVSVFTKMQIDNE